MSAFILGGPFGRTKRNEPVKLAPANPLPENSLDSCSGNAGRDGYSRLSRADRASDLRPSIGGIPTYWGPRMSEEQ